MIYTSDASRQYRMQSSAPQQQQTNSSSRPTSVYGATYREDIAAATHSSAVPSSFEPMTTAAGPLAR